MSCKALPQPCEEGGREEEAAQPEDIGHALTAPAVEETQPGIIKQN